MFNQVATIEGPIVNGVLLADGERGPLVPVAPPVDGAWRPRTSRYYNYKEAPALASKARGRAFGVAFKRRVPYDRHTRELIEAGIVRMVGEPTPAPAHVPVALRLEAADAGMRLPVAEQRQAAAANDAKDAAAALAKETKKKSPSQTSMDALQAEVQVTARRLAAADRDVKHYEAVLARYAEATQ